MEVTNQTILRGFLAHLHSLIRQRAANIVAATEHPDATEETRARAIAKSEPLREQWESIRSDVFKVLGVQLKPWHELSLPGPTESFTPFAGRDELRITFRVLKARCDKARRKDPTIKLLKQWNIAEREPKPEHANLP